jgi:hypothetical protein
MYFSRTATLLALAIACAPTILALPAPTSAIICDSTGQVKDFNGLKRADEACGSVEEIQDFVGL